MHYNVYTHCSEVVFEMKYNQAKKYILENLTIIKTLILSKGGGSKEHNLLKLKNNIFSFDAEQLLLSINKISLKTFLKVFSEINELEIIKLNFKNGESFDLYIFFPKEHSIFTISNLVQPSSYFAHFTALSLHQLIMDKSNSIYLKREAYTPPVVRNENINQKRVDIAFSIPSRTTEKIAFFKWNNTEYKIILLEGLKLTRSKRNFSGVKYKDFPIFKVSNIERTLLDCIIKPTYSGGVQSILTAFKEAKKEFNVDLMCELVNEYNMTYPYERSVALYMEKAHYSDEEVKRFLDGINYNDSNYDFYLDNQIISKKYDEKLKIYYPSWIDDAIE